MTKINPIIAWWMTPKLPPHDIFELPSLKDNSLSSLVSFYISRWIKHPIRRRRAKKYLKMLQETTPLKVIAITGSAGKTTTTEILALILKQIGETVWSANSVDSVYNIPNTILQTKPSTKYLILEMSVEYQGEMDFYLWLARPSIGVITNIYPTHTEFFGNPEGVLEEKSKLVKSLDEKDIAVLNSDDKSLKKLGEKLKSKIVWFGKDTNTMISQYGITKDLKASFKVIFDQTPKKSIKIETVVLGEQFAYNALAAATVANLLGSSLDQIKKGIESYKGSSHRMAVFKHDSGAIIFDDSYNNNPNAAKEAIKTFLQASEGKKKIIVFGDMRELGNLDKKYHQELGKILGNSNLEYLLCIGESSKLTADMAKKELGEKKVDWAPTYKEAIDLVKPFIKKDSAILVKGSRSLHLEYLIEAIK